MRRFQLFFIGGAFAIGALVAACSGDDNNDGGPGDGSVPDVKPDKQPLPEASTDAPIPVAPAGKELAPSDEVQIFGITTDGYVIYADSSAGGLYAADTAGAAAAIKIAAPTTYAVGVAGSVVFVWSSVTANEVGALSVWTHSGTYTAVTTNSAPNGGFAASADGKHILYVANSNTAGAVGDFMGANIDATGVNTLVSGVDIGSANNCRPHVGFASNTEAVTSTCTVTPPDGGTPSATISTYAIAGSGDAGLWTPAPIITGALDFWSTDTAGDQIMVATTAATSVFPIGGGAAVPIDTKNIFHLDGQNDWTFAYMEKNGANVLYSTAAGELLTAANSATPAPTDLQATGAPFIRALSADEKYIMYTTNFDSQQFGGDLYLTKATAPAGAAVTLNNTTTSALFGITAQDDFSADSSYVIWIQNLDTNQGIGDLYAVPVAGGTSKQYATGVWQNASATATKVVYNDNCSGCSGAGGTGNAYADLEVLDLAVGTPTKLQPGADVPLTAGGNSLWLDNAKTHVIYTYSQDATSTGVPAAGGNGLYSLAIP